MSGTRRALVAVFALSVFLAACGDGNSSDSTATTTGVRQSTTTVPGVALECATVGFTPQSEDAASSVTATGLSCAEAEAFVRIAGRQTSSGGPDRVDVEGYSCLRTSSQDNPLPVSSYACTNGPKRVTFDRS